jgi:ABC-type transport system involved in multi-copper enzyme maturation permease subunit
VICLMWRQHRGQVLWAIIAVAALCMVIVTYGLSAEHWLAGYQSWLRQLAAAGCPPPDAHTGVFHVQSAATCAALKDRYLGGLQPAFGDRYNAAILLSQYGLSAAFAIIGALVGAPLVAREIEERTHLAAWTQSISRRRWYVTKSVTLGACLIALGLIAGTANAWLQRQLAAGDPTSTRWSWFGSIDLALAGEVVLAFALGVALGALIRRTLPAIGAAVVAFTLLILGLRWVVLEHTPTRTTTGPGFTAPPGSWLLDPRNGFPFRYHPPTQFVALQLILLGVLLAVAASALVTGWLSTRDHAV